MMLNRLLLLFAALPAWAQQPFSMVEIDEIGNLSTDLDQREFADLGLARAYAEDIETLRVEGRDAQGLPWRVWLPKVRGFGATRVFSADFDANGRVDLLFSALYPGNGRCVEGGTVTALLFDDNGRPVPWRAPTHGLTNDDSTPVTILDLDADGRAELVTTECEYSEFTDDERRQGENRWISGVYEARGARWIPERPFSLDTHLAAVKSRFADYRPGFIEWVVPPGETGFDPLEGWGSRAEVRLAGLLTWEIGCRGLFLLLDPDPVFGKGCEEAAARDRIRLSDGRLLAVWPATVIDSPAGREIDMADSRASLERILGSGSPVRMLGPSATPDFAWTSSEATVGPQSLGARLAVSAVRPTPLKLTEELPPEEPRAPRQVDPNSPFASFLLGIIPEVEAEGDSGMRFRRIPGESLAARPNERSASPRGTYFSRDGRCFLLVPAAAEERHVLSLPDCSDLGDLQPEAAQGKRIRIEPEGAVRIVSSIENTLVTRLGSLARSRREIRFEPSADRRGEVIGAVRFDPGWLVQWSLGAESWLVLHSDDGEPISPTIRHDLKGELFRGGRSDGLTSLRWEDGVPKELTAVRAAIEWIRAE